MFRKHAFLFCSLMFLGSTQAHAATFTVTTTLDEVDMEGCTETHCSLREAVDASNNSDPVMDPENTIILPGSDQPYTLSIAGANEDGNATGDLDILRRNLTIQGDGADVSVINAAGIDRALDVHFMLEGSPTPDLILRNIGITGGLPPEDIMNPLSTFGGAIRIDTISSILMIENSSIFNNSANGGSGGGVAVLMQAGPVAISINGSSISNNTASIGTDPLAIDGYGGGLAFANISNFGISLAASIVNSTISTNTADIAGGGIALANLIDAENEFTISMAHVTIAKNSTIDANGFGGAGIADGTTGNVEINYINSIIAQNTAAVGPADCLAAESSIIQSLNTFSIVGNLAECGATAGNLEVDPIIGDLSLNIGPVPTLTHALLDGSPAIDLVPVEDCVDVLGNPLTTDQRGITRPQGTACDAGAYEANCGDGIIQGEEECDAGELNGGDECTLECTIPPPPATCGNGEIEVGEQCDDGNNNDFDGCSAVCVTEFLEGSGEVFSGCQLNQSATAGNPWIWSSFFGVAVALLAARRKLQA